MYKNPQEIVDFESGLILSPEGVLHEFRLHLCHRPVYKILVQNMNN